MFQNSQNELFSIVIDIDMANTRTFKIRFIIFLNLSMVPLSNGIDEEIKLK